MSGKIKTRVEDMRDLGILAAIARRRAQPDIAAEFGVSRSMVAALKQRVMAEDQFYSGEDPAAIRKAYEG